MSSWFDDIADAGQKAGTAAQSAGASLQGTQLGVAIGSAIPGIGTTIGTAAGFLYDVGSYITNLFRGRTLTSWEQQDEVVRPIAQKLADFTAANLSSEDLSVFTEKYRAALTAYIYASQIQPVQVKGQYLAAPEMKLGLFSLIWLGLHFTYHAAPNFSEYETTRRTVPIVGEVFGKALADTEAVRGGASVAKLRAALTGPAGSSAAGSGTAAANVAALFSGDGAKLAVGLLIAVVVLKLIARGG